MPNNVYFGCCPNRPVDFKSGSPTVSIISGVAIFSEPQIFNIMGVGAVIDYDSDNKKAYISGKISTTNWTVVKADGTLPVDISAKTVNLITHPFTSIVLAEAGAGSLMGGNDLTSLDLILNLPQYMEQSGHTIDSQVVGVNYTIIGDLTRHINVYAPTDTDSECNQSMKTSVAGWDTTKPIIQATANNTSSMTMAGTNTCVVHVYDLQLRATAGSSTNFRLGPVLAYHKFIIDRCVMVVLGTGTDYHKVSSIVTQQGGQNQHFIVRNNLILALKGGNIGLPSGDQSCLPFYNFGNTGVSSMKCFGNTCYGHDRMMTLFPNLSLSTTEYRNNVFLKLKYANGASPINSSKNVWREFDTFNSNDIQTAQTDAEIFKYTDAISLLNWNFEIIDIDCVLFNTGMDLTAVPDANRQDFFRESDYRPVGGAFDIGAIESPFGSVEILNIKPRLSKLSGGQRIVVTLTGAGAVQGAGNVLVNGVPASSIELWSDTKIVFVTPAGTLGIASIKVENNEGGYDTWAEGIRYFAEAQDYVKTIKESIWAIFQPIVDCTLIFANQNAKSPEKPYVVAFVTPANKIGRDYHGSPDFTTGISEIIGNREFSLRFQSFGDGAMVRLQRIVDALESNEILWELHDRGLAYIGELSGVSDLSEIVDKPMYEERASLDLSLRYGSITQESSGVISEIEGTLDFNIHDITAFSELITITL